MKHVFPWKMFKHGKPFLEDAVELPVTLPVVKAGCKYDPLALVAASVKHELAERALGMRDGNVTAQLMGDPSPERSALGRACLESEYASKKTQGRYSDLLYNEPRVRR